mgnify:CR=1 FL=1
MNINPLRRNVEWMQQLVVWQCWENRWELGAMNHMGPQPTRLLVPLNSCANTIVQKSRPPHSYN